MILDDIIVRSLCLSEEQIEQLLDSLDETSEQSEKKQQRRHQRTPFRSRDVTVTLFDQQHMPLYIFSVCTRNLSLGGLAFLHDQSIEPETMLRVDISTSDGEKIRLYSRTAHCRRVSENAFEVGVQFLSVVDDDKFSTYASRLKKQNERISRKAS